MDLPSFHRQDEALDRSQRPLADTYLPGAASRKDRRPLDRENTLRVAEAEEPMWISPLTMRMGRHPRICQEEPHRAMATGDFTNILKLLSTTSIHPHIRPFPTKGGFSCPPGRWDKEGSRLLNRRR